MDENKVARFRPVLSGFASRVAGLGIIEILWEQDGKGLYQTLLFGDMLLVSGVRVRS